MIRIFRHYVPKSLVLVGLTEAAVFFLSVYLGVFSLFADSNPASKLIAGPVWTRALLYTVMMMVLMAMMGLYVRGLRDDLRGILFRIALVFLAALLIVSAALPLVPQFSIGSSALSVAFVASALGITLLRSLMYHFADRIALKKRVLVVGAGSTAAQIERQLRRKADWFDKQLLGYVPVAGEYVVIDDRRLLRANIDLLDLAREHRIHEIVIAVDEGCENLPVNEILDCKLNGIEVVELTTFFEQQTGRLQLEGLSVSDIIFADGFVQAVLKNYLRRAFDVVVSLMVLSISWPLMLAATAAIFVESGGRGPILYRQERVGRNGKRFQILKFRSMAPEAENGTPQWALANDQRITHVGAFIRTARIDELPQLINVLKGEMSFVGPRPERPEFVRHLGDQIPFYDLRHRVNPGITGWAQISYPYGGSVRDAKEKLEYDLYYIKNYSLFLDLMILIQTAQVVLWGRGAR